MKKHHLLIAVLCVFCLSAAAQSSGFAKLDEWTETWKEDLKTYFGYPANELGISERRLRHTIFNAYDKTVDEYLQDRRIQAACRLLREPSEMTPDEISHESGFASQAAFHAAFKSAMGQTPEQYRNMTRRQN